MTLQRKDLEMFAFIDTAKYFGEGGELVEFGNPRKVTHVGLCKLLKTKRIPPTGKTGGTVDKRIGKSAESHKGVPHQNGY